MSEERCGNGSPSWWDQGLLGLKEIENSPSVLWFWCERPLPHGAAVADGWNGPITNLASGEKRGEGKWVRVLADEMNQVAEAVRRERAADRPGGAMARRRLHWRWTAAAKALHGRIDRGVADAYVLDRLDGGAPGGVACFAVEEMWDRISNHAECRYPEDPDATEPPEGATPPEGGGVEIPPGTTPGGGDRGDR